MATGHNKKGEFAGDFSICPGFKSRDPARKTEAQFVGGLLSFFEEFQAVHCGEVVKACFDELSASFRVRATLPLN
jgi:hypothetical protein